MIVVYRVSNESFTLDDFLRGDKEVQKELFAEWETSPEKARLSSNAIDAGFKVMRLMLLPFYSFQTYIALDSPDRGRAEGDGSGV